MLKNHQQQQTNKQKNKKTILWKDISKRKRPCSGILVRWPCISSSSIFSWKNFLEEIFLLRNKFSSAHISIENSFGRLKVRFRCLQGVMNVKLDKLPPAIYWYLVLHNYCKKKKKKKKKKGNLTEQNLMSAFEPWNPYPIEKGWMKTKLFLWEIP